MIMNLITDIRVYWLYKYIYNIKIDSPWYIQTLLGFVRYTKILIYKKKITKNLSHTIPYNVLCYLTIILLLVLLFNMLINTLLIFYKIRVNNIFL